MTNPHHQHSCLRPRLRTAAGLLCLLLFTGLFQPRPVSAGTDLRDLKSDTWVAVDEAGRALPTPAEARPPQPDKTVGIFYFLWHGPHDYDNVYNPQDDGQGVIVPDPEKEKGPYNLTEWAERGGNPEELGPSGAFHHWGESENGYYLSDDEWVIRRHIRSLVDAGVDVLIMDATNGFTYRDVYMNILRIMQEMRDQGEKTPQIAFMAGVAATSKSVKKLVRELYEPALHEDLWFKWQDKPLLLVDDKLIDDPDLNQAFTLRKSWAWSRKQGWFGDGRHAWPWIDIYPQGFGWDTDPSVPEAMAASAAGHPTRTEGRSYHKGKQPRPGTETPYEGLFFAEQLQRALEVDPQFLMVTGWNEWVAQRLSAKQGQMLAGKRLQEGDPLFVDCYSTEFNRDIEPDKTPQGDNLYHQLVAGIRKFKGAREVEAAGPEVSIPVKADPAAWTNVTPEFLDSRGDTTHRNHPGWGRIGTYTHTMGRNDILSSKVARDGKTVVFAATTADSMTPPSDPGWMELFLNTDRNFSTGWSGFDLMLGPAADIKEEGGLVRFTRPVLKWDGSKWVPSGSVAQGAVRGNFLEVALPRSLFPEPLDFYFKWADNPAGHDHILDLEKGGDTAPNRRFQYHFRTQTSAAPSPGASQP
ncbi:MAG: hypothetical protein FGM15_11540 [Chthoniobacterales bacterium]|nr:hypothetical protein [Chthoniobacterales bacterium]